MQPLSLAVSPKYNLGLRCEQLFEHEDRQGAEHNCADRAPETAYLGQLLREGHRVNLNPYHGLLVHIYLFVNAINEAVDGYLTLPQHFDYHEALRNTTILNGALAKLVLLVWRPQVLHHIR